MRRPGRRFAIAKLDMRMELPMTGPSAPLDRPAHPDLRFSWQGPRSGPLVTQPVVSFPGRQVDAARLIAWQVQDPAVRGPVPGVSNHNVGLISDLISQLDRSLRIVVFAGLDDMVLESWIPLLEGVDARRLVLGLGWGRDPELIRDVRPVTARFQDRGGLLAAVDVNLMLPEAHPFFFAADLTLVGSEAVGGLDPDDERLALLVEGTTLGRSHGLPVGAHSVDSFRSLHTALSAGIDFMSGPALNRLAAHGCVYGTTPSQTGAGEVAVAGR